MRGNDLIARIGGNEFTLLAYKVNRKSAQEIAGSFIQLMQDFALFEAGDTLKIRFSIAITIMDDGAPTSNKYLKEANTAMHEARASWRNNLDSVSKEQIKQRSRYRNRLPQAYWKSHNDKS